MYYQGDLVIVKFPFTDLSDYKPRPALIVSNSAVNRSSDYIVVMLTTSNVTGRFVTTISNADVTPNFKPPHSIMNVNCKKIAVLNESIISKKICEITNITKFSEIVGLIKSTIE